MTILDTTIFSWVFSIFSLLWNDVTGRIFLLTFIAYASSYMLYSGYLSWFSKGFGGITLSQTGFNFVDFLSLIPATFILFYEFLKTAAIYISIYLIGPVLLAVGFGIWIEKFKLSLPTNGNLDIANIGALLWLSGIFANSVLFALDKKKWFFLAIIVSYAGVIIFSSTISTTGYESTNLQSLSENAQLFLIAARIMNELIALPLLILLCIYPYIIGSIMAELSFKQKILNEIAKLTTKEPLRVPGAIEKAEKPLKTHEYYWSENKPIYLIATFSQTTAIFIPASTKDEERGELLLLKNELINSIVLKGRKEQLENKKEENKVENNVPLIAPTSKSKKRKGSNTI